MPIPSHRRTPCNRRISSRRPARCRTGTRAVIRVRRRRSPRADLAYTRDSRSSPRARRKPRTKVRQTLSDKHRSHPFDRCPSRYTRADRRPTTPPTGSPNRTPGSCFRHRSHRPGPRSTRQDMALHSHRTNHPTSNRTDRFAPGDRSLRTQPRTRPGRPRTPPHPRTPTRTRHNCPRRSAVDGRKSRKPHRFPTTVVRTPPVPRTDPTDLPSCTYGCRNSRRVGSPRGHKDPTSRTAGPRRSRSPRRNPRT